MKVCIVGGGIIGLSSGLYLLKHSGLSSDDLDVTLISDKLSPNTTADGAAGIWGPYLLGQTPESDQ